MAELLKPEEMTARLSKMPPFIGSGSATFKLPAVTSFADLYSQEFPAVRYVVDKLIIKQGLNLIYGQSKAGKTFVALEIAIQAATAGKVFGYYDCPEVIPTLIVNEEDQPRSLHDRIRAMTDEVDMPISFHIQKNIRLDDEKTIEQLVAQVKEHQYGLVIFDNLARLHLQNENASNEMTRVINSLMLITQVGASVVLLHHPRKTMQGEANSMSGNIRGSTVILNSMDTVLSLERVIHPPDHIIAMEQTKNKQELEIQNIVKIQLCDDVDGIAGKKRFVWLGEQKAELSNDIKLEEKLYALISAQEDKLDAKEVCALAGIPLVGRDPRVAARVPSDVVAALASLASSGRLQRASRKELGIRDGRSPQAKLFWASSKEEQQSNIFSPVYETPPFITEE